MLMFYDGCFDVVMYDYDVFLLLMLCLMCGRKVRCGGVDVNASSKFGAREMSERGGGGW